MTTHQHPEAQAELDYAWAELRSLFRQWERDELDGPILVMEALGKFLAAWNRRASPSPGDAMAGEDGSAVSQIAPALHGADLGAEPSAAFTPGPWRMVWTCDGGFHIKDANLCIIARRGKWRPNAEQSEANARLIAAAPDLLEALRALKSAFDAFTEDANWGASALRADTIRQVNDAPFIVSRAIAKALGAPSASPEGGRALALDEPEALSPSPAQPQEGE